MDQTDPLSYSSVGFTSLIFKIEDVTSQKNFNDYGLMDYRHFMVFL